MNNIVDYILIGVGIISIVSYIAIAIYYMIKDRSKFISLLSLTLVYIIIGVLYSILVAIINVYLPQFEKFNFIFGSIALALMMWILNLVTGNRLFKWYAAVELNIMRKKEDQDSK